MDAELRLGRAYRLLAGGQRCRSGHAAQRYGHGEQDTATDLFPGCRSEADETQYAEPIFLGSWPDYLKQQWGENAPHFTEEEWKLVKGSSELYVQVSAATVGQSLTRRPASVSIIMAHLTLPASGSTRAQPRHSRSVSAGMSAYTRKMESSSGTRARMGTHTTVSLGLSRPFR